MIPRWRSVTFLPNVYHWSLSEPLQSWLSLCADDGGKLHLHTVTQHSSAELNYNPLQLQLPWENSQRRALLEGPFFCPPPPLLWETMNPGAATCFYTSPPSSKHLCAVVVSLFFSSFDHKDWETKETTAGGSHWLIPPFWRQLADGMFPATTLKSWSCDAEDLSFQMLIVPVTINSTALARGDRKYVNCTSVTQTDRFLTLKQHLQHCNLQVV